MTIPTESKLLLNWWQWVAPISLVLCSEHWTSFIWIETWTSYFSFGKPTSMSAHARIMIIKDSHMLDFEFFWTGCQIMCEKKAPIMTHPNQGYPWSVFSAVLLHPIFGRLTYIEEFWCSPWSDIIVTSGYPWPSGTVKSPVFLNLVHILVFLETFFFKCVFFFLLLFFIIKIKCFFFTFMFLFIWMQVWSLEKEDTPHSFSSRVFLHYYKFYFF